MLRIYLCHADHVRAQKETGVILLPSYLEAEIVPEDIEIRLASSDEDGLMFVDVDEII